jgi:threonine/homoserine/homoserine lactone efflux protein
MESLHTVALAIMVAFLGFAPPGMINMTALKISMEHRISTGLLFVSGASVVIFVQALIAVAFAGYLGHNPQVVQNLTIASIGVFLLLAVFFYRQARRKVDVQVKEPGKKVFLAGIGMAAMNMLGIPFFLGYSTFLEAKGWLDLRHPQHWWFALGAMAGAWLLFSIYVFFAPFIQRRVQFIARNINYILSLLFLSLAVITFLNIIF